MNQKKSDESIHSTGDRSAVEETWAIDNAMGVTPENVKQTRDYWYPLYELSQSPEYSNEYRLHMSQDRSALDDIRFGKDQTPQEQKKLVEMFQQHAKEAKWEGVPWDFMRKEEKMEYLKSLIRQLPDEAQVELVRELAEEWAEKELKNVKMPGYTQQLMGMLSGSEVYHVTGEGVEYKGPVYDLKELGDNQVIVRTREEWLQQYQNKEHGKSE